MPSKTLLSRLDPSTSCHFCEYTIYGCLVHYHKLFVFIIIKHENKPLPAFYSANKIKKYENYPATGKNHVEQKP